MGTTQSKTALLHSDSDEQDPLDECVGSGNTSVVCLRLAFCGVCCSDANEKTRASFTSICSAVATGNACVPEASIQKGVVHCCISFGRVIFRRRGEGALTSKNLSLRSVSVGFKKSSAIKTVGTRSFTVFRPKDRSGCCFEPCQTAKKLVQIYPAIRRGRPKTPRTGLSPGGYGEAEWKNGIDKM